MVAKEMIALVDQEIARLVMVRKLLSGENGSAGHGVTRKGPGIGRRPMSAEARERIAQAQRKRWAAQKKAAKKAARQ